MIALTILFGVLAASAYGQQYQQYQSNMQILQQKPMLQQKPILPQQPIIQQQQQQQQQPQTQTQQQFVSYNQKPLNLAPVTPIQTQNPCEGRFVNDKLPVESNTKQFIHCLEEGQWQLMSCGDNLVFNPNTDRCEHSLKTPKGCSSNPCLNNGKCIDLPFFQYRCECTVGFTGDWCEKIDGCSDMSCGPSGSCVNLPTGAPLKKYCLCNGLSTFGIDCSQSIEVNPCLTNDLDLKTYPTKANPAVYVHCEGQIPYLRFCNYPLVYSHSLQQCDWTATPTVEVVPKMVSPTSYSSYGQQTIDRPIQKIQQTQSGY